MQTTQAPAATKAIANGTTDATMCQCYNYGPPLPSISEAERVGKGVHVVAPCEAGLVPPHALES